MNEARAHKREVVVVEDDYAHQEGELRKRPTSAKIAKVDSAQYLIGAD